MEQIALGNAGFDVSRFCMGTWNMCSDSGWGPDDEKKCSDLIHHALDSGCNFIDSARGYGDSEEVVGRALKGRRDKVHIATKQMHCPAEQLRQAVETSLKNLQTDYIDLYICHWPSPSQSLDDFFGELDRQREAGKILAIGVSNFNLEQMKVAHKYGVASLQPPFSIVWRCADEILAFCRENNIAVTPYSPLAQGLLTGRYSRGEVETTGPRKSNVLFKDPMFPHARKVAAEVDAIADRMGCASSQVALAWLLKTPGITCPIVGASSIEQWNSNTRAFEVQLPDEDYERLDRMGREVWGMVDPEDAMWGWKPQ